jgi:hypothetical protein
MKRLGFVAAVMLMASGCGAGLPEVHMDRMTPKPMKVGVAGFSVNRFYMVNADGKTTDSPIPVTRVSEHYAAFRKAFVEGTSTRFGVVEDASLKENPAYQAQLPQNKGMKVLEKMAAATPDGMIAGRPQDPESIKLCSDLGLDGIVWISGSLTQVPGAFAIGGLGSFKLEWDGTIALIGKNGVVWSDNVKLKSDKSFAAANGLASPNSLAEAADELAPKIAGLMVERLNKKAGP